MSLRKSLTSAFCCLVLSTTSSAQESNDADYVVLESAEGAPSGWSTLQFTADKSPVTVAAILGSSVGRGYSSTGGTATVVVTTYQDLCIAPCTLAIKPGLRKFMLYGGALSSAATQLDLRADSTYTVEARMRSALVQRLGMVMTVGGLTVAAFGVYRTILTANRNTDPVWWAAEPRSLAPSIAMAVGGTGLLIGGIPVYLAGTSRLSVR